MADEHAPEDREGFGEASLGEAQSENPPSDPEMIEGDEEANRNPERQGPDPGWEPTDEPLGEDEDRPNDPPPESRPGDSGESSTPRR